MAKRIKRLADWLFEYGIGFGYALLVSVVLGLFAAGMLLCVLFAAWWDRVR